MNKKEKNSQNVDNKLNAHFFMHNSTFSSLIIAIV